MSKASRIATVGTALAMAATPLDAQDSNNPVIDTGVSTQYTLVEADPIRGEALVAYDFDPETRYFQDCDSLEHHAETAQREVSDFLMNSTGLSTPHLEQTLIADIANGFSSLAETYASHADIVTQDPQTFRNAAILGADKEFWEHAANEAGCNTPSGYSLVPSPQ